MTHGKARAVVLPLGLFTSLALSLSCGDPAPPPSMSPASCLDEAGLREAPRPLPLGDFLLDQDGHSAPAQVSISPGPPVPGAVLLRLLPGPGLDPAACLQIHALEDGDGKPWVTPPASRDDLGPYCRSCPQRVAVAVGGGSFVLPSGDGSDRDRVAGPLTLRGALRDCETLLSARPAPGRARYLRVEALGLAPAAPERRGVLPVEILITPSSPFADPASEATLTAAFALLNQDLAQAGVSVAVLRRHVLAGAPEPLDFTAGDHGALRALVAGARCPDQAVAPIVFSGCLRLRDPVLGRTDEPEGYATHIPGGTGDGVFIKGRSCVGPFPGAPFPWPASLLAKVLLHELGHFLGLYHTVEQDGAADALPDTGPDNIMHFRPTTEGARGLSPAQVRVLRRHPFVRYP
jgi:hypothetical protein